MEEAKTSRKVLHVLSIEDEHFIGELYARALAKAGFDVKTVTSGQQGFSEAKTGDYDIILLDLMLPEMTGMEVLKRLRNDVPNLKSKVIISTNLEQDERTRKEIEKQADGYLVKAEITPKQLVEFVQKIS